MTPAGAARPVAALTELAAFGVGAAGILGIAWSDDGRWLATAGDDGRVHLWQPPFAAPAVTLAGHQGPVTSVRFSPDGRLLASSSKDATVRLWDVAMGREARCFSGPTAFRGVDWDPSGRAVLALQTKRIHFWQAEAQDPPRILFEHDKWVRAARWLSPDRIVSCGDDGQLIFWDAAFQRPTQRLVVDPAGLGDIAVLPGDKPPRLALALHSGGLAQWRTAPFVSVQSVMRLGDTRLIGLAASTDGKLLAAVDDHGRIDLLLPDLGHRGGGLQTSEPPSPHGGRVLDFHPHRATLAVADGARVRLLRCDTLAWERAAAQGDSVDLRQATGGGRPPATDGEAAMPAPATRSGPADVASPERNRIFFSHAAEDRRLLDQILTLLEPLSRSGAVRPWHDGLIRPGEWAPQIDDAMQGSAIAVFLVSAAFMASKFVNSRELPTLLERARQGGVQVTWLMLEPALVESSGLDAYQCFRDSKRLHGPDAPLSRLSRHHRNQVLAEFCRHLGQLAGTGTGASSPA